MFERYDETCYETLKLIALSITKRVAYSYERLSRNFHEGIR